MLFPFSSAGQMKKSDIEVFTNKKLEVAINTKVD